MTVDRARWGSVRYTLTGVIRTLVYALVTAIVTIAIATAIGGGQRDLAHRVDESTQETRALVSILVNDAEDAVRNNRTVLCLAIIGNRSNIARDDPRVVQLCEAVGVRRSDFGETRE